jgi:hypothetical protein
MSYSLHDYVSVIQFLASICFALSFEKVLDFSFLGKAVSKYNEKLYLFYTQQFAKPEQSNEYPNICKKYKAIENLPINADNKVFVSSCLGPYTWWFLLCALFAFSVLIIADGYKTLPSEPLWWWGGMFFAFLGVLSWGILTLYMYLYYRMNARCIEEAIKNIDDSYGLKSSSTTKSSPDIIEQVRLYQLLELDKYFGRIFLSKLWYFIFHDRKTILKLSKK